MWWKSNIRTVYYLLTMSKYCVWRLYFYLQKMVLYHRNSHNIKIADPSDLVNCHTRYRVCNSSAVENCYCALLKLFVGSTVCIITRTIKLRTWLCPLKYYTNPCAHLWHLTTADTKSFIPDNTNNIIDNLGEYIYSKAYSQTNKNGVYGW